MFISYDLKFSLLAHLLRLANILNLGEDENILERAVCTALSQERTRKETKRKYKTDIANEVGTKINKTWTIEVLKKIDGLFRNSGTFEKQTQEYISQIEQH